MISSLQAVHLAQFHYRHLTSWGGFLQFPDCLGDLVPTGLKTSHEYSETEKHQIFSATLDAFLPSDPVMTRSENTTAVAIINTKEGIGSQTALEKKKKSDSHFSSLDHPHLRSKQLAGRLAKPTMSRPGSVVFASRDLLKSLSKRGGGKMWISWSPRSTTS